MMYISTRGKSEPVPASVAIMQGLAPDGGLYIPEEIPALTRAQLRDCVGYDYRQKAKLVLGMFLTDFSEREIEACVDKAYTAAKFGSDDTVPLHALGGDRYLLELWHGPTCAFKDIALQILPHLLLTSMRKNGEEKTAVILVATSGDTGKAALEGFCDVDGSKIMVFYPQDGVSNIQKLQMITQDGANVCSVGIEGNFDDAQTGVKAIFSDPDVQQALLGKSCFLSSANSINWGRLVPQIVYYIDGYCKLCQSGRIAFGDEIDVVVPTGNFGNILAAYFARRMGLPVRRFVCASNANDVLTDFIHTGVYDRRRNFYTTISPSMDILISSNLERMLYYLCGEDAAEVRRCMDALRADGVYEISDGAKQALSGLFAGGFCDDAKTKSAILREFERSGYVCDPHTAVAVQVYGDYAAKGTDGVPALIASTASPYKFAASVLSALGETGETDEFLQLDRLAALSGMPCPPQLCNLQSKPVRFPDTWSKDRMLQSLYTFLHI